MNELTEQLTDNDFSLLVIKMSINENVTVYPDFPSPTSAKRKLRQMKLLSDKVNL